MTTQDPAGRWSGLCQALAAELTHVASAHAIKRPERTRRLEVLLLAVPDGPRTQAVDGLLGLGLAAPSDEQLLALAADAALRQLTEVGVAWAHSAHPPTTAHAPAGPAGLGLLDVEALLAGVPLPGDEPDTPPAPVDADARRRARHEQRLVEVATVAPEFVREAPVSPAPVVHAPFAVEHHDDSDGPVVGELRPVMPRPMTDPALPAPAADLLRFIAAGLDEGATLPILIHPEPDSLSVRIELPSRADVDTWVRRFDIGAAVLDGKLRRSGRKRWRTYGTGAGDGDVWRGWRIAAWCTELEPPDGGPKEAVLAGSGVSA